MKSIFKKAGSEKTKWNTINDSRNIIKFSQNIFYFKNCFDYVITDNYKIAQLLNYKFSKLGDYIGSAYNFFPTNHRKSKNSFDFRFVNKKEVLLTLKNLNLNKPLGPSDIPSWALKDGFLFLADPIKLLFNQFLGEEKLPEDLKKAIVTPILKKRRKLFAWELQTNIKTISLAKTFESLLREQTLEYLEKFGMLSNTHYGFRNKVLTIDALICCAETIRYDINNNN